MVWLLERNNEVLTCEIRQAKNSTDYVFEVASHRGPVETWRFLTPTDLINGFLRKQTTLQAQGWRPRAAVRPVQLNQPADRAA
jgi:hypothetical protein